MCKMNVMTWMLMVTITLVMMQVSQHCEHALGSSSCMVFAVHFALTASQCDFEDRPCFDVMACVGRLRACLPIQRSTHLH